MPELRKDPVVGQWVIIATERARRPGSIITNAAAVPEDNAQIDFQNLSNDEIYSVPGKNKDTAVRVIPHPKPLLNSEAPYARHAKGLYNVINGYGAHEVVIESPHNISNMADLSADQIQNVIQAYTHRMDALALDKNLKYCLIRKDYLSGDSETNEYPSTSEIIAAPVIPSRVKDKMAGAKKYYDFHERCVYSDVVYQESESGDRVLMETEHFIALTPFASRFPFEIWILPRKHDCDFARGIQGCEGDLAEVLKTILSKIKMGLDDPSYSMAIHTSPFRHPEKTVRWKTLEDDFCWHIEITPKLTHIAGFEKGTDFYICPIPPEVTTEYIKRIKV